MHSPSYREILDGNERAECASAHVVASLEIGRDCKILLDLGQDPVPCVGWRIEMVRYPIRWLSINIFRVVVTEPHDQLESIEAAELQD